MFHRRISADALGSATGVDSRTVEDRFVATFHAVCGAAAVSELTVDRPEVHGPLADDFPEFRNGARVSTTAAERLVRAVLRESVWCALAGSGGFCVTFGFDTFMYVRSPEMPAGVRDEIENLGLHVTDIDPPDDELFDGDPDILYAPAADEGFWKRAAKLVPEDGDRLIVSERWAYNEHGRTWYAAPPDRVGELAPLMRPRSLIHVYRSVAPFDGAVTEIDDDGPVVAVTETPGSPLLEAAYARTPEQYAAAVGDPGYGRLFFDPDYSEYPTESIYAIVPDPDGRVRSRWDPLLA